jgi:hypothetical protein
MTSFTLTHPPIGVTRETEENLVAAIHRAMEGSDVAGMPLSAVLQTSVAEGHDLHAITTTLMQLIRGGQVDLTADRNLRWVGDDAS